ncbi:MAG: MotA/TolQ/ExbB proton channel family protein [Spartobacteria bacterium]|nr:MotA/TolQ/ExbB proton channel family protein [Spartobacteria bacterium]
MMDVLNQGGPVIWLIFGMAVVAAVIFLERLFHLHRAQIRADDFLKGIYNVLKRRNIVEAVSICEETAGPVAHIVRAAVLHHDEDRQTIQQAIEEAGLAEVPRLERNLNLLATIAQISPLAGLLGTVLGMMDMLVVMHQNAPLVHAGDLSGGLWKALLTTAAGLAVSIPAYAAYNFLIARIESVVLDMERSSVDIFVFLTRHEPALRKEVE